MQLREVSIGFCRSQSQGSQTRNSQPTLYWPEQLRAATNDDLCFYDPLLQQMQESMVPDKNPDTSPQYVTVTAGLCRGRGAATKVSIGFAEARARARIPGTLSPHPTGQSSREQPPMTSVFLRPNAAAYARVDGAKAQHKGHTTNMIARPTQAAQKCRLG